MTSALNTFFKKDAGYCQIICCAASSLTNNMSTQITQLRQQVLGSAISNACEHFLTHWLVYHDHQLVAAVSLEQFPVVTSGSNRSANNIRTSNTGRLRQLAVQKDYQHTGIGRVLVTQVEEHIARSITRSTDRVPQCILRARSSAVLFYQALGYQFFTRQEQHWLQSNHPHFLNEPSAQARSLEAHRETNLQKIIFKNNDDQQMDDNSRQSEAIQFFWMKKILRPTSPRRSLETGTVEG